MLIKVLKSDDVLKMLLMYKLEAHSVYQYQP